jgi:hypothetical protein
VITPPSGYEVFAAVRGLNNRGDVAGTACSSGPNRKCRAFVRENGVWTDLNTRLPAGSGWELTTASDINDAGQIAGTGLFNGQSRDFLLTPASETTPPALTAAPTAGGAVYAPGAWTNKDVAIRFVCTDDAGVASLVASGAASGSSSGGPAVMARTVDVVVPSEGANQSVKAVCTDSAGLTAERTVAVNIDKTAPKVKEIRSPARPPNGWHKSDVSLRLEIDDGTGSVSGGKELVYEFTSQLSNPLQAPDPPMGSGVLSGASGTLTFRNEGIITLKVFARDQAGNQGDPQTIELKIDKTAPQVFNTGRAPAPNANGWNNSDVTLTWDCVVDNFPGHAVICPSTTRITTEGANQVAEAKALDQAGNEGIAFVNNISIDKTAPALALSTDAATYTVDQSVTVTCTASDALSGIATSSLTGVPGTTACQAVTRPAYEFAIGANALSATATDKAGNTTTRSASFTVQVTAASLGTVIGRLVTDGGVAASLQEQARGIAQAPNANAKAGMLRAFENHVAAQTGKSITPADAALLVRLARAL